MSVPVPVFVCLCVCVVACLSANTLVWVPSVVVEERLCVGVWVIHARGLGCNQPLRFSLFYAALVRLTLDLWEARY